MDVCLSPRAYDPPAGEDEPGVAGVLAGCVDAGEYKHRYTKQSPSLIGIPTGKAERVAALLVAAKENRVADVEQLLRAGVSVDTMGDDGWTALLHATWRGRPVVVRALISAGASLEAADPIGRTALIIAAFDGQAKIVGTLLTAGANVNAASQDGATPLICAAFKGRLEIAEALIDEGAALEALEAATPELLVALDQRASACDDDPSELAYPEVVKLLVARGAKDPQF
jgi:ankyrin repeat protein